MASGSECGSDVSSSSDVHELPGSGSGVQQPARRASGGHASRAFGGHASSSSAVEEPAERGSGVQPPAAWDFSSSMDVDEAPGYISSVQQPARPASGGLASSSSAAAALVEEIGSFSPHPVRIEPGDVSFTHERKFPLALHLLVRIAGELYEATYAGHGHVKHVFLLHGKERRLHNTVLKLSLEPDIEPRMLILLETRNLAPKLHRAGRMSECNTKGTYIKSWHAWICARLFPLDQIIKHPLCPEYVKRELIMLGVICFLRAAVFWKVRFTDNGLYNLGLDTAGYVRILDCGWREPQQGEVSKKDINHTVFKQS